MYLKNLNFQMKNIFSTLFLSTLINTPKVHRQTATATKVLPVIKHLWWSNIRKKLSKNVEQRPKNNNFIQFITTLNLNFQLQLILKTEEK